jgi:hypothetical protein
MPHYAVSLASDGTLVDTVEATDGYWASMKIGDRLQLPSWKFSVAELDQTAEDCPLARVTDEMRSAYRRGEIVAVEG